MHYCCIHADPIRQSDGEKRRVPSSLLPPPCLPSDWHLSRYTQQATLYNSAFEKANGVATRERLEIYLSSALTHTLK